MSKSQCLKIIMPAFINLLWCTISTSQMSFAKPLTETAQQQQQHIYAQN